MEQIHFPLESLLPVYLILSLTALLVPILSEKIRIPAIVGLILSGILLGHSATNLIAESEVVRLPSTLGLLYIMFLAGLEIDLQSLEKQRNHSMIFGLFSFILPFLGGMAIGKYFLHLEINGIFLIGAMFASHTLLTLPILSRFNLSRSPVVTTVVGGTIITDILAILVLALVAGHTRGSLNGFFALRLIIFLLLTMVLMRWLIPKLGRWFFFKVSSDPLLEFGFVMVVFFAMSFGAQMAGLESIVGAIFAGIAINRLIPENSALMNRVRFVGNTLFIPIFLISVGLIIDLHHLINSPRAWIVAGVMFVGGTLVKYLVSVLYSWIFSYSPSESLLIFGMSINRASTTLAAVLVGYNLQIFDKDIVAGTVVMILGTCILGPVFTQKASQRLTLSGEGERRVLSSQPQRILIAVGSQDVGIPMVNLAVLLRDTHSKEPIHPLNVVQQTQNPEEEVDKAERLLTGTVVQGNAAGVPIVPLARVDSNVSNGILRAMLDQRISILIAAWNGERPFFGSVYGNILDQVLQNSRQMVFVTNLSVPLNTVERIVLVIPPMVQALEGYQASLFTLKTLASQLGCRILVLVHDENIEGMEKRISAVKPDVSLQVSGYDNFHQILDTIDGAGFRPSDMLVMFCARIGQFAWQPKIDRFSGVLIRKYRSQNTALLFPPLPNMVSDSAAVIPEMGTNNSLFGPTNMMRVSGTQEIGEILSQMVKVIGLPENRWTEMTDLLINVAIQDPVELKPGIILVHAHVDEVDTSLLMLGICESAFTLPKIPSGEVLILLLVPRFQTAEEHLKTLSAIAKEVRVSEFPRNI